EVDLQRVELRAADAARPADALFRKHRRRRRRGALLRLVWNRQDDAVERSRADARRRGLTRVERSRRIQFRRRMLRENDSTVARSRAADLRDDAALRNGA